MSTDSDKETQLDDEDIEQLAKFFDLLARFDFEDKQKEDNAPDKPRNS